MIEDVSIFGATSLVEVISSVGEGIVAIGETGVVQQR